MSAEAIATSGVGVTLLAVLVPLLLALRADLRELSRRVGDLAQRIAHVEGALAGPWRPDAMPPPHPPGETP